MPGRTEETEAAYRKVIALAPALAHLAAANLAGMLMQRGLTKEGEALYRKVATLVPERHNLFGRDPALVDRAGRGHGEKARGGVRHHRERLAGMAEDELRLGVVLAFLVEFFDPRHLASGFGSLDAVAEQHDPAVGTQEEGVEEPQGRPRPEGRKLVAPDGPAVEHRQQAPVTRLGEAQRAHKLVTPRMSARVQMAASATANQRKVRYLAKAGRNCETIPTRRTRAGRNFQVLPLIW